MSHNIARAASVATLVLLMASVALPAAAIDKEHRQLAADIRMLQDQSQQLQNLLGTLGEALKALNARLGQQLDQQAEANRKAFADQRIVMDNLSSDVRVIREKLDDNNVRIGSISQELDALRQSLQQAAAAPPRATTELDPSASAGAPGGQPAGGAPPPPSPPPLAIGTSPQKLYETATADYMAAQYDLAILGFESFIRTFPKSDLADNVQLSIGNAYLQDGKNDKAAEAYDKAIRTYPTGDAIPEAYFKKGQALQNLKDIAGARQAWEYAVKAFPGSTAAIQSSQRLEQLR